MCLKTLNSFFPNIFRYKNAYFAGDSHLRAVFGYMQQLAGRQTANIIDKEMARKFPVVISGRNSNNYIYQ